MAVFIRCNKALINVLCGHVWFCRATEDPPLPLVPLSSSWCFSGSFTVKVEVLSLEAKTTSSYPRSFVAMAEGCSARREKDSETYRERQKHIDPPFTL